MKLSGVLSPLTSKAEASPLGNMGSLVGGKESTSIAAMIQIEMWALILLIIIGL